jgi:hypothetical protein
MIELSGHASARNDVSSWLALNHEKLGLKQIKLERSELPVETISAWYEVSGYLVDICVWEHANCLDVLVYEQSSGSLVFREAGPCRGTTALLERLTSFSNWVAAHAAGG